MNATCLPDSIACSAASAATIVLPEPTSPCSSRCIGDARFKSCAISRHTRSCARVSLNGARSSNLPGQRAGAGQHRRAAQRARLAMRLERQLLREQLVELEPRPRRMRARIERVLRQLGQARRRRMQEAHRVAELPQLAPRDDRLGQRFRRSAPDRRRACARRPCAASPARVPPSSDTRASGDRAAASSSATTLNCGCTISRPKWPARTSPNTRTR